MTAATLVREPPTTVEARPSIGAASRRPAVTPRCLCGTHRTLFAIPFRSPMSDADIRRVGALAGLDCDLHPKLPGTTVSPGVRRLDFASGLFLVRGEREGEWRLEGRTWGTPAPGAVHRWHLWAAAAARGLDPGVPVPTPGVGVQRGGVS